MRMDVTFSQTEMAFSPAFDTIVSVPVAGDMAALNEHLADDSNPHCVTAQQIGAVTQDDLEGFKEQVIADVIAALPVYNGEVV